MRPYVGCAAQASAANSGGVMLALVHQVAEGRCLGCGERGGCRRGDAETVVVAAGTGKMTAGLLRVQG